VAGSNFALASFDEPHAWLIRGLIEYGWPDVTPLGGRVPPGRHGGLELARFRDTTGRDGIHLLVPAVTGGQACHEDGVYDFTARLYRKDGQWTVAVRCAEANYLAEFPFDPDNPLYAAGYVHQGVGGYVQQFVQWRLGGGELSWAQRKGLPEIEGEPCSAGLNRFLDEMIRTRRSLDSGPAEGWWIGATSAPPPPGAAAPVANAGAMPAGPIAVAGRAGAGGATDADVARDKVNAPARMLRGASVVLVLVGLVSLLNALLTVVLFFLDRPAALASTACVGVACTALGAVSVIGAGRMRDLKKSLLPWVAIGSNIVLPLLIGIASLSIDLVCCGATAPLLLCVPIALWSLAAMVHPAVIKTRDELARVQGG